MKGNILRKAVKDVNCEERGWVARKIFSFYNIDVTKVAEFGSSASTRRIGAVTGYEENIDINMMTNDISKVPSKIIYIENHFFTSMNDSEMIT